MLETCPSSLLETLVYLTLAMGGPTTCPESALTVSDLAFLWATVIKSYGRSAEKQGDLYTTALGILSAVNTREALCGAIWGVHLKQKEPAVEKNKPKAKGRGKGKAHKTVPAPAREEAGLPTAARQGSV
jgi:hypothetical protein